MRKTIFAVFLTCALGCPFTAALFAQQSTSTQQKAPASTQKPSSSAPAKTPAKAATPAPALTTDKQKESYALGMNIGKSLKNSSVDSDIVDVTLLLRGLKDALTGAKPLLSDQDVAAVLPKLQAEVKQKADAARKELGDKNLKEGREFLAANKGKEGVVTLPDGLQYKILKEGSGPKPTATDSVACQYRGTLVDGTEFDSSAKRGPMPAVFPVNRVIKGWTEALQMMPAGSKWELFVPPDLAYGERGAGNMIGPNATLIFDVELVSIQPPPASQKPPQAPGQMPNAAPPPNPGANPNANPNPSK